VKKTARGSPTPKRLTVFEVGSRAENKTQETVKRRIQVYLPKLSSSF
jgi:hypothetical protein